MNNRLRKSHPDTTYGRGDRGYKMLMILSVSAKETQSEKVNNITLREAMDTRGVLPAKDATKQEL